MHPFSINIWSYFHHVKERMFYAWKETSFRREPSWLVSWCALLLQDVQSDTLLRALLLDFAPQGVLQFLWLIDLHIRNVFLSHLITYRGIIHWTSRCMQYPFLLNLWHMVQWSGNIDLIGITMMDHQQSLIPILLVSKIITIEEENPNLSFYGLKKQNMRM